MLSDIRSTADIFTRGSVLTYITPENT